MLSWLACQHCYHSLDSGVCWLESQAGAEDGCWERSHLTSWIHLPYWPIPCSLPSVYWQGVQGWLHLVMGKSTYWAVHETAWFICSEAAILNDCSPGFGQRNNCSTGAWRGHSYMTPSLNIWGMMFYVISNLICGSDTHTPFQLPQQHHIPAQEVYYYLTMLESIIRRMLPHLFTAMVWAPVLRHNGGWQYHW